MTDQQAEKQKVKALWENRIVGYGDEPTDQIMANPNNFRIHPTIQQNALTGSLESLGWIDDVIINRRTGNLIDGHLRVILAMRNDIKTVPAKYVDLSPEEETLAIMMLDPISALAATDHDKLAELFQLVNSDNDLVTDFLEDYKQREAMFNSLPSLEDDSGDGTANQRNFTFKVVVEDTDKWEEIINSVRTVLVEHNWKARIEA